MTPGNPTPKLGCMDKPTPGSATTRTAPGSDQQALRVRGEFELCVATHGQAIRVFVAGRATRSRVDDLCQEIWKRVWEGWEKFDGTNQRAWLFTVARNHLTDWFRSADHKRAMHTTSIHGQTSDGETADLPISDPITDDPELDDHMRQLRHCLEQLDALKRSIVEGWLSEKPSKELAKELGLEPSQVDKRFHTAKQSLRTCMQGANV